jgi:hypothetical protein
MTIHAIGQSLAIIFTFVCFGIVPIWYAFLKMTRPERIREAASYAESHHA